MDRKVWLVVFGSLFVLNFNACITVCGCNQKPVDATKLSQEVFVNRGNKTMEIIVIDWTDRKFRHIALDKANIRLDETGSFETGKGEIIECSPFTKVIDATTATWRNKPEKYSTHHLWISRKGSLTFARVDVREHYHMAKAATPNRELNLKSNVTNWVTFAKECELGNKNWR